ncbi:MAG: epoxyqueuosine reductase QueH [Lachnospiraceae bacterium]|nr:epoxyqueuosine reductase QueH [Lachnospiraceae bacterium]
MKAGINYHKEMEKLLLELEKEGRFPSLLLHSCCAPCSTACLERLAEAFRLTVFYYNPNIWPPEEYEKRVREEERLCTVFPAREPIRFLEGSYDRETFLKTVKGLESLPEGGERCERCFRLRLFEAARAAAEGGFDFFTTTLTLSPLKDADLLNRIGREAGERFQVAWLPCDFKKKDGFLRSIALSEEYGLYRQDYCGCEFSLRERREQKERLSAP